MEDQLQKIPSSPQPGESVGTVHPQDMVRQLPHPHSSNLTPHTAKTSTPKKSYSIDSILGDIVHRKNCPGTRETTAPGSRNGTAPAPFPSHREPERYNDCTEQTGNDHYPLPGPRDHYTGMVWVYVTLNSLIIIH